MYCHGSSSHHIASFTLPSFPQYNGRIQLLPHEGIFPWVGRSVFVLLYDEVQCKWLTQPCLSVHTSLTVLLTISSTSLARKQQRYIWRRHRIRFVKFYDGTAGYFHEALLGLVCKRPNHSGSAPTHIYMRGTLIKIACLQQHVDSKKTAGVNQVASMIQLGHCWP